MSNRPTRKPTKLERERAMYAKLGMKHPKDAALDTAMENLKGWCRKMTSPCKTPDKEVNAAVTKPPPTEKPPGTV